MACNIILDITFESLRNHLKAELCELQDLHLPHLYERETDLSFLRRQRGLVWRVPKELP